MQKEFTERESSKAVFIPFAQHPPIPPAVYLVQGNDLLFVGGISVGGRPSLNETRRGNEMRHETNNPIKAPHVLGAPKPHLQMARPPGCCEFALIDDEVKCLEIIIKPLLVIFMY